MSDMVKGLLLAASLVAVLAIIKELF